MHTVSWFGAMPMSLLWTAIIGLIVGAIVLLFVYGSIVGRRSAS